MPSPPRSILFPYTTLFRSNENVGWHVLRMRRRGCDLRVATGGLEPERGELRRIIGVDDVMREPRVLREAAEQRIQDRRGLPLPRSEEHTSELQSLTNLVCRLLRDLSSFPTRRSSDLMKMWDGMCCACGAAGAICA